MNRTAANVCVDRPRVTDRAGRDAPATDLEKGHARRYPLSRWYVCPVTARIAAILANTPVRPNHLTLLGLLLAAMAAATLVRWPQMSPWAAALVLAAWCCDRTDGLLARRQATSSAWGAWFDGNIDELTDIGLHIAVAVATATELAWWLLVAFLAGKYLFIHGLASERELVVETGEPAASEDLSSPPPRRGLLHVVYHLPGNADIRLHLLLAALLSGCLTAELACVAVYYNLRWILRYRLVARRLGGKR